MTKYRSLTALALVLALLCALAAPVGAAGAPRLTYRQSGSTAVQLTLQNLGEESIYGVQLELTLAGSYDRATLAPASSTSYAPPCTCSVTGDTTLVTVYLTAQSPLNSKGTLSVGTLTLPSSFTMPEAAALILLGHDLKPLTGRQAITVSRQSTSSGGSSGSSGGSGGASTVSSPTPAPTPSADPSPSADPLLPLYLPFTDVSEKDWYYDGVKYVYDTGLMNGTGENAFSPNVSTSRAMLVTILYRLAGSPPAQLPPFSDVSPAQYYAYPVGWAAQQSIVNGYETGLFQPDTALTREQLATILYRYSRAMGYNTTVRGDLTAFSDRGAVSSYAAEAMSWAVASGLLSGTTPSTLSPSLHASRAQVALILARFCKNVAKI